MTSNDELWKAFGLIIGSAFETALPIFTAMFVFTKGVKYFADKERAKR